MFTDDSELNVESLIENLKDAIMEELSVLCVTRSFMFLSALSVPFSAASLQSSTPASVSDSLTPATPVPATLTPATSGFAVSAFVISSLFASVSETILIEDDNTAETILFCL
ncbi:uncharacterized protein BDCG_16686 [Blastomyces dermatitidis ER-3]|uniref:Uncharacterized protein n=1 Tax=Ajellomyces dermatitidis (strain ER-3 / ATCC MYA-2586) TaxID=559297 RepID=A0ABX2VTS9_AJEDR|nr:uncharacterized protein BDCG_16686 [Blastomyces dermatitidis ER-3]OAT00584.1 hypothetical protein BDCG_16686 [Blastomyces dermatitidis ER-3]